MADGMSGPRDRRRTIHLIFFDAGGGHRNAATALQVQIEKLGLPLDVSLVNLQEVLDPLDILRKMTGIRIQDMYNKMLRNGWTLGSPQLMRVLQLVVRTYHGPSVRVLDEVLEETHAGHGGVSRAAFQSCDARELIEKACPGRPFVTVLTDLADYPKHFWIEKESQYLADQKFEHAAQQIVFQEGIDAIEDALQRLRRLEKQLALIVPEWSMAPVVEAYQAMRGASFLVAVTFAAEIGDVRRFDTPRQLMSFLGLVPAESSTGDTIRRKGLTLAGNRRARRALVEAAWTYRYPARVSETLRARLEGLPKPVRDIAWKAQVRLCARYRRLSATGKKLPDRRGGDCSRDGRVPVGHRTGGRAGVTRGRSLLPLPRAGSGARKVGNSRR